jgi:hypothetical protein
MNKIKRLNGMKKIWFSLIALVLTATAAQAQRLVIGEKAPEIKVSQWVDSRAAAGNKATLVDFFHSSNAQCIANLPKLNTLQETYGARLNVIVVSSEGMDKLTPCLDGKGYGFYAGTDDAGKTFAAYAVRFVPFAALIDSRGRLVWTGNVASLTDETIKKAL